jgi:Zn-dependent protease
MLTIRSILRYLFAVSGLGLVPMVFIGLVEVTAHDRAAISPETSAVYGVLVANSLLSAMAWWSIRKPRTTRSYWAIAACIAYLVEGLVLLHYSDDHLSPYSPGVIITVIAIAGLIAFCTRREPVPTTTPKPAKRTRKPGDCTRSWIDQLTATLFALALVAAIFMWMAWASEHNLASNRGAASLPLIALVCIASVALHECGHALAAACFNMKLLSFRVGPFEIRQRKQKWQFKFENSYWFGGLVVVVPTNPAQPPWQDICMLAAGPAANLITGLIFLWAALRAKGTFYEPLWDILALAATYGIIIAVLNLIPVLTKRGFYSDGARILQLLTHSPMAEYHRLILRGQSTMVTALRPRDMDIDALQRVAATQFPQELRGLHLQLCAMQSHEDCGRLPEARVVLASADAIYRDFTIDMSAPLHTVFVTSHAWYNRDAAAARLWWDRMIEKRKLAKKPDDPDADYWLARTALLWIEGRRDDAEEAWQKAAAEVAQLPRFGAYDFMRDQCANLRRELDLSPSLSETPPAAETCQDNSFISLNPNKIQTITPTPEPL